MVEPFPPSPPPPPPPPQNPGQPMFAQQPGAAPFQPGPYAPPPPAKSGGCFKGCCIVGVIVGVLAIIGCVVFAMNFKKLMAKMLAINTVDKCADLTPAEKEEGHEILEKVMDAAMGAKANDQQWGQELTRHFNDLSAAAQDGKVEGSEIRPPLGRMKKMLKDAGYSLPSNLYPYIPDSRTGARPGMWTVRVTKLDESRLEEVIQAINGKTHIGRPAIATNLKTLPATVLDGVAESDANDMQKVLEGLGCKCDVKPAEAEAPH